MKKIFIFIFIILIFGSVNANNETKIINNLGQEKACKKSDGIYTEKNGFNTTINSINYGGNINYIKRKGIISYVITNTFKDKISGETKTKDIYLYEYNCKTGKESKFVNTNFVNYLRQEYTIPGEIGEIDYIDNSIYIIKTSGTIYGSGHRYVINKNTKKVTLLNIESFKNYNKIKLKYKGYDIFLIDIFPLKNKIIGKFNVRKGELGQDIEEFEIKYEINLNSKIILI